MKITEQSNQINTKSKESLYSVNSFIGSSHEIGAIEHEHLNQFVQSFSGHVEHNSRFSHIERPALHLSDSMGRTKVHPISNSGSICIIGNLVQHQILLNMLVHQNPGANFKLYDLSKSEGNSQPTIIATKSNAKSTISIYFVESAMTKPKKLCAAVDYCDFTIMCKHQDLELSCSLSL